MSRSNRHKEKYQNNIELSQVHFSEGTSARTRPFSFEDIMLRRKNKKAGQIEAGPGQADNREHNFEKAADCLETDRDRHHDSVHGSSMHFSEDSARLRSKRNPINEGKLAKDRDRSGESRDFRTKSNFVLMKNLSHNHTTEGKSDRHVHSRKRSNRSNENSKGESGERHLRDFSRMERPGEKGNGESVKEREYKQGTDNDHNQVYGRRRDNDQLRHDYENKSKKRHSRVSTGIDKYADAGRRKSGKESRGKRQYENKEEIGDQGGVKKHSMHTSKSSEFLEKKEKEPSRVHYEELRPKRKRSRSRERDKERSRRSSPVSPRAHKHTLPDEQAYPPEDKSHRSHADAERKRISSNGSSSNNRRYAGSSSRLGGYSPRKRKTEAAAKTPSPAARSPERRTAGWDYPPAGKEGNTKSSIVSHVQSSSQIAPENGPKPSSMIPVTPVVVKPVGISQNNPSSQMHAIDSIQLTQATRPMRRLYVENLPSSASEKAVVECINNFLLSSGVNHIKGTLPCISCMIHKEKGQALLEFLTPEDASAALYFDGRSFFGSILKIRRPKDFVDATTGIHGKVLDATNWISDNVEDSSHKIFIGGISKVVSSEMLMEIAGAFGILKAFRFEHHVEAGAHCAFLEYVDHFITKKACAGLNGMKLGGQVLTVVQATPDAPLLGNANQPPLYEIPEHAKSLLKDPTAVLKLKNVLDPEGISSLSEAELEEILEDIRLECARFGSIKAVNIVKHMNDSISREAFATVDGSDSALECRQNLDEVRGEISTYEELARNDRSEPSNSRTEAVEVDETVKGDAISDDKPDISNKPSSSSREPDDANKISVSDDHSDGKHVGNLLKDETCESTVDASDLTGMDTASLEIPDIGFGKCTKKLNTSTDHLVSSDKISDDGSVRASEMENEVDVAEIATLEDDIGRSSASELDSCRKKELNVPEKGENEEEIPNVGDSFEAGSVLVEFKRAEASCMAAHSLHGRPFDDRIVTVEYVDPDLYHKRFPI